ncbi:MAG: radical SAM protein [Fusobacteriaceae bacterium]|nr:radical SAM protein [Fusobacteriaceae bacterium]
MNYNMPLYRPPSEAYSLIVQATLGCSHNKCTFCDMYKTKKFIIKPIEQIKKEIDYYRETIKSAPRVFLADGDALIIEFEMLSEIIVYIKERFPECNRISMYGSPKSILLKSEKELKELKNLGVFLIYLGLESGDDEVLKSVNKGVVVNEIIDAGLKVKAAGIKLSITAIAGLGGKALSNNHAINTGRAVSVIQPEYFSILSLMYNKNTELYKDIENGSFAPLENFEILNEIKKIIQNIDTESNIIFRSNHASNYLSLEGTFPKDKNKIIDEIDKALENNLLIPEMYRAL